MEANRTTSDEGNRPVLIATVGLPGSGKSTWARNWVAARPNERIRVCRDDIRSMITGLGDKKMVVQDENYVTTVQNASIEAALRKGYDVVVDATHLRRKNLTELDRIARRIGADFEVNDLFTDVDLSLCLLRNAKRGENAVPDEVVRDMHRRFLSRYKPYQSNFTEAPVFEPYVKPDKETYWGNRPAYLVDIDGTLANMHNRSPYDETKVFDDHPNENVINVVHHLGESRLAPDIILMSGRSEDCRAETERWLKHHDIWYDNLHMRASGDQRKDDVVKYELFNEHVRNFYNVLGVFDDRNQVVKMWRDIGLTVFQVADGDF